eukprot:19682-Heterococcus_DN1.PRE.3
MARLQYDQAQRSVVASAPAAVPTVTLIGLDKLIQKGLPPRTLRIRKRPGHHGMYCSNRGIQMNVNTLLLLQPRLQLQLDYIALLN